MEPYVYPGTSVLKYRVNIRDLEELNRAEAVAATRRIIELETKPPGGKFNSALLRSIHSHIFRDVYAWAGEFLFADLAREGHLSGLRPTDFCQRAGNYLGELNAIHPFREGNGRSQGEIIGPLARRCGYTLSGTRVWREEMYHSFGFADHTGLAQLLQKSIDS